MTNLQTQINQQAGKFLGKALNDYKTNYDPSLLVPIERELNRRDYNIQNDDFLGFDVWHNYECSFLTDRGYPVTLIGKIKIPADSPKFIESKSMKLYFFSLHMERLGATVDEAIENYVELVTRDLSLATESSVEFQVFTDVNSLNDFHLYTPVEELVDVDALNFDVYNENPDVLVKSESTDEVKVLIRNVRSNCRVTHQPDFANLFLRIKGNQPTVESILSYVVSFRNEYHFHEEVTEQLYKNIKEKFNPEVLGVYMLFTRRGGLDICPCRYNTQDAEPNLFADINLLTEATPYQ